jgi:hypothetical protein
VFEFLFHYTLQTSSAVLPASYPKGAKFSFSGVKQPGCEADDLPLISAEIKKTWMSASNPRMSSWHSAQLSTGATFPLPYLFSDLNCTFTSCLLHLCSIFDTHDFLCLTTFT